MMRCKLLIWPILLALARLCDGLQLQQPIVVIEMGQSGFHRELTYKVYFAKVLRNTECEYVLEQQLPASIFVNTDQLYDMQRFSKLNITYPSFVDVELPMERATPLSVLLLGAPKSPASITLPIHFRYHAPSSDRAFVLVNINPPTLYMSCAESELPIICHERLSLPHEHYCLYENATTFYNIDSRSDAVARKDLCNWKRIQVVYQIKTPLSTEIPIGHKDLYGFVWGLTIMTSFLAAFGVMYCSRSVQSNINAKLEEQRQLFKRSLK